MKKCPICEKDVLPQDKFCIYCGEDLRKYKSCIVCGESLLPGDKFCIYCGEKQEGRVKCKKCDKYLYQDDKYCIYCGSKQSDYVMCDNCYKYIYKTDKYCIYCGRPNRYYTPSSQETYQGSSYSLSSYNPNQNNYLAQFSNENQYGLGTYNPYSFQLDEEPKEKNPLKTIIILGSILAICICLYLLFFKPYSIEYVDSKCAYHQNPTSYSYVSSNIILQDPEPIDGYSFDGWYLSNTYQGRVSAINSKGRQDIKLYAKWRPITYNINYNCGTNCVIYGNNTYTIEDEVYLPTPYREGYQFSHWAKSNGTVVDRIPYGTTGNQTFVASWTENVYTIEYRNIENSKYSNPNPYEGSYSKTINLKDMPYNSREGYTFDGWYEDPSFIKRVFSLQHISDPIKVLYAKWTPIEYTISYNNLYSSFYGRNRFTVEDSFYLDTPYRSGYRFDGWVDQYGRTVSYVSQGTHESLYLSARWVLN